MQTQFQAFCLLFLSLIPVSIRAQQSGRLDNTSYSVELKSDASVKITHKLSGRSYTLAPKFTIMRRMDDPVLKFTFGNASQFAPNTNNKVRMPFWVKEGSKQTTANFFESASPITLSASSSGIKSNAIEWNFPKNSAGQLSATLSLTVNINEPVIEYKFIPSTEAWYSVGYTGMPELEANKIDAIWQPFIWQEKRFPEKPFLSTENMCGLPGTMVEKDGMTYGVLADPSVIPYRLPYEPLGHILFGVLVRNQKGNAQPQIFSPVLGNPDSKLKAGALHSFKFRVFMFKGSQPDAYIAAAKDMFGFKDYRQNVYANLNQTIENMIDFQMDDVYSGWSKEMKGYDYSTDVANTVKNVSGLHPLSVALITDNQGIYTRRALPIIEYLLSREKYHFSMGKNIKAQQPSSKMTGPAAEVSELAVLNMFYKGNSPIFKYFADSLSHTTRQLNLNKDSKGDDWPNLLALYKMSGEAKYLTKAKEKADEYIKWRITTKQSDFSDASTAQSALFFTDYSPLWMEMLSLYEATKEPRYLEAAKTGAKQYMQYTWFYPVIPDSTVLINKNGISEFLWGKAEKQKIKPMVAARQEVPAWRVSQIGLTPESANTLSWNPAIFLTNHAPHLLRLAYYTHDDFFRSVARSAVVGRYTNYPGYDINGEFNTIYSRPDYPLRTQDQVSYNEFYYNHVWPQIAMLFDYLISDLYASSKGSIDFPGQFAVGYAYLKSNVFGQAPGKFYGDENVNLWMPKQVLKVDNEQINYVTGYGNGKFYCAFLNQSSVEQETEISINPDIVPVNLAGTHSSRLWKDNASAIQTQLKNGKIKIRVSPKGITALAIDGISVVTQLQQAKLKTDIVDSNQSFKIADSPFGKIKSAMLGLGDLSSAYIWLEANNDILSKATLSYHLKGAKDWLTKEDANYPFEFSVPLSENDTEIEWWIKATTISGQTTSSSKVILKR